ncbi:kxDL motif-containing protein 1 [Biomphalaria pfeifferi]|uniref:KxDL motif-containing protein 1 n=1 Tax=Biomphalaria pfeifferi TaxID=112525 RepID=A0AAD8FNV7_BIOPF|nr:kxDL motif-containing protein 1 [Biomphalaria pfeifferi]
MDTINSLTESMVHDDASMLASSLIEQVNTEDIASMVYIQRDMLARFEKTNEMLINFNMLSLSRYEATLKQFHKHTGLLSDMKKDLDTVFKRIRLLKQRLEKTYPEAFSACSSVYNIVSEDEGDDTDDNGESELRADSCYPPDSKPSVTVTSPR